MTVDVRFALVVVTMMVADVHCCIGGGDKSPPPPPPPPPTVSTEGFKVKFISTTTRAPILCSKARDALGPVKSAGFDPWVPICTEEGGYAEDQCHFLGLIMSSTLRIPAIYHWKVDPVTGVRQTGTTTLSHDLRTCMDRINFAENTNPQMNCSAMRTLILDNTADGNAVMLPECDDDEFYRNYQCYDEMMLGIPAEDSFTQGAAEGCWCVDRNFGGKKDGTCDLSPTNTGEITTTLWTTSGTAGYYYYY